MKKYFLISLLFISINSFAFIPVALAPLVYGSGSLSAGAGASVSGGLAGWGLLLGAAFGVIGISDTDTNKITRIPLTTDPDDIVPEPFAPSTAPVITGNFTYHNSVSYAETGATCFGTYTDPPIINPLVCGNGNCGSFTNGGTLTDRYCAVATPAPNTCPTGYTLDGSSCVLTSARLASPDNKCDFSRSGSSLSVLSDPDCNGGASLPNCNFDGSSCTSVGINPATGLPRSITITTTPAGGSSVIVRDETSVGNISTVETTTIGVSSSGIIDSVSGSVNEGTLPVDGSAPTGNTVQPVTVEFPTDYARENTQQSIQTELSRTGQPLPEQSFASTVTQFSADLAGLFTGAETARTTDEDSLQGAFNFGMPAYACSPFVGTVGGETFTWDFCFYTNLLRRILGWLFALFGAYTIYNVIFRPRS